MSLTAPEKNDKDSETLTLRRRKVRQIPNTVTRTIGQQLRTFREQRGMTQLELAMSAEVERTRISKLELGLVNPSVLTLATICHVLGITLADLFAEIPLSHPRGRDTAPGEPSRAGQETSAQTCQQDRALIDTPLGSHGERWITLFFAPALLPAAAPAPDSRTPTRKARIRLCSLACLAAVTWHGDCLNPTWANSVWR